MKHPLTKEEIRMFADLVVAGDEEAVEIQRRASEAIPKLMLETDPDVCEGAYEAYARDIRCIIGTRQ